MSDPRAIAGHRRHTKNRATGTTIVLVSAEEQGIAVEDGGKWAIICDDHGSLIQDDVQSVLIPHMSWPEWCDDCRQIIDAKASA